MLNFLMDLLFPEHVCCLCRQPGRFNSRQPWCDHCDENMKTVRSCLPICEKCGKYLENEGQSLCTDCRKELPAFKIGRAVGPYSDDSYRIAVKVLKFLGRKYMAVKMGNLMAEVVKEEQGFWPLDLIVPVPSSAGSARQRGFNQSALLARQIGKKIGVAVDVRLLVRVKETPSQRELTREEREKNLLCAFQVQRPEKIKGKHILLVDDVYTTGSTIRECTRTLLDAGAASVAVVTWATGKSF